MYASSRKSCITARTLPIALDRPHIVPAVCVSMVTRGVAGSKVWRNLRDNPKGQHTEFQLTASLSTRLCVCVCVCEERKYQVKMRFYLYMDMVGHPRSDTGLLSHGTADTRRILMDWRCVHIYTQVAVNAKAMGPICLLLRREVIYWSEWDPCFPPLASITRWLALCSWTIYTVHALIIEI